jgi:hypothetical protein
MQSDEIDSVHAAGKGLECAAVLTHRKCITTQYVVKNNSQRAIPQFYIDHTASPLSGGFEIVTKTNAIKSATGFTRYEFKLSPQTDVEFTVAEETKFCEKIRGHSALQEFLVGRARAMQNKGVMDEKTTKRLEEVVARHTQIQALRKCEKPGSLTEAHVHNMREQTDAKVPSDVIEAVNKLLEMQGKREVVKRKISTHQSRERKVFENQERLRQNIKSMEQVHNCGELLKRYLTDLERDEDDLMKTRKSIEDLDEEKISLENDIKSQELSISSMAKKYREQLEAEAEEL